MESNAVIRRLSYDDLNLLSSYRRNTLISVEVQQETETTPQNDENIKTIEDTIDNTNLYNYQLDSQVAVSGASYSINYFKMRIEYLSEENGILKNNEINVKYRNMHGEGHSKVCDLYNESTNENIGKLIIDDRGTGSSIIQLFKHYKPIVEGKDNIFVTYMDKRENESYLINNCKFGVLFGAGNYRNRLFISGNSFFPNTDFHSSQRNIYASDEDIDLLDNQDYTYFSALDYCNYGTSNSSVMGYQLMGDGSLLVIKEKIDTEPSVYFRHGGYAKKDINLGNESITIDVEDYPMTPGNIGEGLIIKNGIFNLNNDIVFLSKNGVYGISSTISSSVLASNYQYAYSRSRLINKELLKYDISKTVCCLFDNKLFITIPNKDESITFVADGRYPYKLSDSIDNEYEYEWFVLKNINAKNYFVINNQLYFSNEKGLFYWDLYSNSYKDIKYARTINDGTIMITDDHIITINQEFEKKYIDNTTLIKFNKQYLAKLMFIPINAHKDHDGYYEVEVIYNQFMASKSGLKCTFGNDNNYITCYLEINPFNNHKFKFYLDENMTQEYTFNRAEFIYYYLDNENYFYRLDKENQVILGDNDEIIHFQISTMNLDASFESYELIPCYYVTKSFNFGQSTYSKILKTLTITNDSELYSKVNFAISTKDEITLNKEIIKIKSNYLSGTKGLDDLYENIFKADLTSKTFASSFTKDFLLKFNYIQFIFYNNNDENCVINNLYVLYTYGFKRKGAY